MNILFTGFDVFGGHAFNPSSVVAEAAARRAAAASQVLPVTFERAKSFALDAVDYDVVIHVGLAAKTDFVRLERYAHNIRMVTEDARREEAPDAVRRLSDGPVAYETPIDLAFLRDRLAGDWDVRFSRDAGTYVCNAIYYHSLQAIAAKGAGKAVFIHVPMWDAATAERFGNDLGELVAGFADQL